MLKIATWNVNSVRARIERLMDFIKEYNPDVLLLQELKCIEEQFPSLELMQFNYNIEIAGEKARNGVAIMSKFPLYDVERSLPLYDISKEDAEARYIEARFDCEGKSFKVASVYVPNGGMTAMDEKMGVKDFTTTEAFAKKLRFCKRLSCKFKEAVADEEIAVFGGDYNVCPNLNMDIYSVNKDGDLTCTQTERDAFKAMEATGVSDVWRKLNPDLQEYSYWGYRPFSSLEKNMGYRLDALMTTPAMEQMVSTCSIIKAVRFKEKASDHVPLLAEINI